MELSHLLIIGAPRSGTTLLATMISRHTEIAVLNEDKGWALRRVLGKTHRRQQALRAESNRA
jgi:Sulfotransferase family